MLIHIIMTERFGEGSWITKVFLDKTDAEQYLIDHKENDELKLRTYMAD